MSSLRLHRVFEWLELQDLIDEALYEVYGDYDMSESIQTRAVAIHHDGFHRVISLREVRRTIGPASDFGGSGHRNRRRRWTSRLRAGLCKGKRA